MKGFDFLQDSIREFNSKRLEAFLESDENNFVSLSLSLGLDPRTDFRNADLAGLDFSNCDLTSFVFEGSDLSFTFGSNIVFPSPDALKAADLRMSPFSFLVENRQLIEDMKQDFRGLPLYDLDPTVTSNWVYDATKSHLRESSKALAKCLTMLRQTKSSTIAIDIVHAASRFYKGIQYRDFMFWVISQEMLNKQVKFACFSILAKVFDRDPEVMHYLIRIVQRSNDDSFRAAAFMALLNSPSGSKNATTLYNSIGGREKTPIRKALIRHLLGDQVEREYYFLFVGGFDAQDLLIDYEEEITNDLWERMCRAIARREFIASRIWRGDSFSEATHLADKKKFTEAELSDASVTVLKAFHRLASAGIEFNARGRFLPSAR
jgi:hypothetical protein